MLIALNITVYIYMAVLSGNFIAINDNVLAIYEQNNREIFNGAYWRLFTAMFAHADILHLLLNMLFLLIFGLRAEEIFSNKEYILIYFLSGLAGNLLTLFSLFMRSVGASGAIFGLFGACIIYFRKLIGQSITVALMYAFLLLIISSLSPKINFLAHFGGLAVGLLIGYVLAAAHKRKIIYRYRYSFMV
jgi:rhomboid protease GluP